MYNMCRGLVEETIKKKRLDAYSLAHSCTLCSYVKLSVIINGLYTYTSKNTGAWKPIKTISNSICLISNEHVLIKQRFKTCKCLIFSYIWAKYSKKFKNCKNVQNFRQKWKFSTVEKYCKKLYFFLDLVWKLVNLPPTVPYNPLETSWAKLTSCN